MGWMPQYGTSDGTVAAIKPLSRSYVTVLFLSVHYKTRFYVHQPRLRHGCRTMCPYQGRSTFPYNPQMRKLKTNTNLLNATD